MFNDYCGVIDLCTGKSIPLNYAANFFGCPIEYIDERPKRMNFERIFSVICTYENNKLYQQPSLYGIIHHYIHWGYNYESYEDDIKNKRIEHLPLIKIWNGR